MSKVRLKPQHVKLIEQNFNLLDVDDDKLLNRRQAGLLFRALGQTLSNRQLNKILDEHLKFSQDKTPSDEKAKSSMTNLQTSPELLTKSIPGKKPSSMNVPEKPEEEPTIDFQSFIAMFESSYCDPLKFDILLESFELFDENRCGKLGLSELHQLLSSPSGEPLTGDDLEEVLLLAASLIPSDSRDEKFDYLALAEKLTRNTKMPSL